MITLRIGNVSSHFKPFILICFVQMQFLLSLILCFALCNCLGASPFGTITITDETGMTVTSYSVHRYAKSIDLQCNYDGDVIDWLITPSNMGVTVWKSGVLRI